MAADAGVAADRPAATAAGWRVAFAGTPEFAAVALRDLVAAGYAVPLVLTQPDRPAGRGLKLQPSAVKQVALEHGLPLCQPRSLRLDGRYPDDAAQARRALLDAAPDLLVVAAYGLILPAWVLTLPRLGCLNIHASLLPRWRGAAPIHRAIEAGDAETGITIMQMDEGLDTGPMLLRAALPVAADDSTASLHHRLATLGGQLMLQALEDAAAGRLRPQPQPQEGVTYAHKVDKAEARLDWQLPAATLARRVRAFDPFPGTHFEHDGQAIKVWRAEATAGDPAAAPGTVLAGPAGALTVACGEGALAMTELQRPGGRRQPATSALPGLGLVPGDRI